MKAGIAACEPCSFHTTSNSGFGSARQGASDDNRQRTPCCRRPLRSQASRNAMGLAQRRRAQFHNAVPGPGRLPGVHRLRHHGRHECEAAHPVQNCASATPNRCWCRTCPLQISSTAVAATAAPARMSSRRLATRPTRASCRPTTFPTSRPGQTCGRGPAELEAARHQDLGIHHPPLAGVDAGRHPVARPDHRHPAGLSGSEDLQERRLSLQREGALPVHADRQCHRLHARRMDMQEQLGAQLGRRRRLHDRLRRMRHRRRNDVGDRRLHHDLSLWHRERHACGRRHQSAAAHPLSRQLGTIQDLSAYPPSKDQPFLLDGLAAGSDPKIAGDASGQIYVVRTDIMGNIQHNVWNNGWSKVQWLTGPEGSPKRPRPWAIRAPSAGRMSSIAMPTATSTMSTSPATVDWQQVTGDSGSSRHRRRRATGSSRNTSAALEVCYRDTDGNIRDLETRGHKWIERPITGNPPRRGR